MLRLPRNLETLLTLPNNLVNATATLQSYNTSTTAYQPGEYYDYPIVLQHLHNSLSTLPMVLPSIFHTKINFESKPHQTIPLSDARVML